VTFDIMQADYNPKPYCWFLCSCNKKFAKERRTFNLVW